MSINEAQFPTTVWDGLSPNTQRVSRLDDTPPRFEDWDQIVAELLATQKYVKDLEMGAIDFTYINVGDTDEAVDPGDIASEGGLFWDSSAQILRMDAESYQLNLKAVPDGNGFGSNILLLEPDFVDGATEAGLAMGDFNANNVAFLTHHTSIGNGVLYLYGHDGAGSYDSGFRMYHRAGGPAAYVDLRTRAANWLHIGSEAAGANYGFVQAGLVQLGDANEATTGGDIAAAYYGETTGLFWDAEAHVFNIGDGSAFRFQLDADTDRLTIQGNQNTVALQPVVAESGWGNFLHIPKVNGYAGSGFVLGNYFSNDGVGFEWTEGQNATLNIYSRFDSSYRAGIGLIRRIHPTGSVSAYIKHAENEQIYFGLTPDSADFGASIRAKFGCFGSTTEGTDFGDLAAGNSTNDGFFYDDSAKLLRIPELQLNHPTYTNVNNISVIPNNGWGGYIYLNNNASFSGIMMGKYDTSATVIDWENEDGVLFIYGAKDIGAGEVYQSGALVLGDPDTENLYLSHEVTREFELGTTKGAFNGFLKLEEVRLDNGVNPVTLTTVPTDSGWDNYLHIPDAASVNYGGIIIGDYNTNGVGLDWNGENGALNVYGLGSGDNGAIKLLHDPNDGLDQVYLSHSGEDGGWLLVGTSKNAFDGGIKISQFGLGLDPVSQQADIGALTDSTGGTADGTLAAISGSGADSDINNNFADLAAKVSSLRSLLQAYGLMA